MIVVHPKDPSTRFLHLIYEDIEGVLFFDSINQREKILEAIKAAPREEFILLLGHGSPQGLLGGFIGDGDAGLRQDRPNLVGIWCYASTFAERHHLKGFFSGMFISELYEADANDVTAAPDEIADVCWNFSGMFGDLLRAGYPLETIAADLMSRSNNDSELAYFNHSRLTYRITGLEPLPVEEDYWGFDDLSEDKDHEIVSMGIKEFKSEMINTIWLSKSSNLDSFVCRVERKCLKLLADWYEFSYGICIASLANHVNYLTQTEIEIEKIKTSIFKQPYFILKFPDAEYTLSNNVRGYKSAFIGLQHYPYPESELEEVRISPNDFCTMINQYHYAVRPLIKPMLDDLCIEIRKRLLIKDINSTIKDNQ